MQDKNEIRNNRIDHIYRLLDATTKSMEKIKVMLKNLDKDDQRKSYEELEGIMGTFDGTHLVTSDGQKHEVPANYSAKSRLVIGDSLKMIEEDGKHLFKQVEKVDRKKVEGILTKKEGKWHIISDSGTYRVSDIAADFQHAELNDEASAFVPAKNLNVAFAALDMVKKKKPAPETVNAISKTIEPSPKVAVKQVVPSTKAVPAKVGTTASNVLNKPRTGARPAKAGGGRSSGPAKPYKPAAKKEYVEDIVKPESQPTAQSVNLDEDDLR